MLIHRCRIAWSCGLFLLGLPLSFGLPMAAHAQQPTPIEISELPTPPDWIDDLLKLGKVTFTSGPADRESESESGRQLAAETHFRIGYDYRNRARWNVKRSGGQRLLVIAVRYSSVRLTPTHKIWLRNRPEAEQFWQHPLVLHELDHVQISSDPRLTHRFAELLRDSKVIEKELSSGDVVNAAMVNRLVDQHVKQVFEKISELAAIRYKELDRATDHGIRPLPESSPLRELLREQEATP